MGFYSGMRLTEILELRRENVNIENGMIRLDPGTTKNDEPRVIPLIGELPQMLKILREKNPSSEYVFTREGAQMHSFRKAWNSACIKVGLGELKPRLSLTTKEPKMKGKKPVMKYHGRTLHDLRRCGVSISYKQALTRTLRGRSAATKQRAFFSATTSRLSAI